MALLIKGDDVREMAEQLQKLAGQSSMADAVRLALRNEIARRKAAPSLLHRLADVQAAFDEQLGPHKVTFDQKEFWDQDEEN